MTIAESPLTARTAERFSERPWRRAFAWLCFLAPFFYVTYGVANWLASLRPGVPSILFDWEHAIPFLGWTIIPYWSINVFYGLSLFVCTTRDELDTHGRRLLTAQVVAVLCFILFPLRFAFTQPETGGLSGFLFAALTSFDQPFNQAPSLHIALLVILWVLYARHIPRWALCLLHPWFALIGVSVLTTYQHHFIDMPTGRCSDCSVFGSGRIAGRARSRFSRSRAIRAGAGWQSATRPGRWCSPPRRCLPEGPVGGYSGQRSHLLLWQRITPSSAPTVSRKERMDG